MAKKRLEIPEAVLRELYLEQRLTMSQIGKQFGYSTEIIRRRLCAYDIPSRSSSEAALLQSGFDIPEPELRVLYLNEKLSTYEIARRFNCSAATIRKRLHIFGIPLRSRFEGALAHVGTLERLKDFSGDLAEKAYLIGFRIGDLTTVKRFSGSEAITLYGGTTRTDQVDLIFQLFEPYGYIRVTQVIENWMSKRQHFLLCSLNSSFVD
jgi:hypothetical protein